jgi:RNA recognition motif-containing protein
VIVLSLGRGYQSRSPACLFCYGPDRPFAQPGTASRTIVSEYFSMSKIYVGNLPFSADEAAVRTLFATHGTVESVALITDRDTGQPRGFGFVEMANADAARAIQSLNGHQMDGRALKVNEAQPKTDRPRRAW